MPVKFHIESTPETYFQTHWVQDEIFNQVIVADRTMKFMLNLETRESSMEVLSLGNSMRVENIESTEMFPRAESEYELRELDKKKVILGFDCHGFEIVDHQSNKTHQCFAASDCSESSRLNIKYPSIPGAVLEFSDHQNGTAIGFMSYEEVDTLYRQTPSEVLNLEQLMDKYESIFGKGMAKWIFDLAKKRLST